MTDRPLAPLLTEDAMLSVRHADDPENYPYDDMTRVQLYAELDAQRAALAELRAKVARLRSPIVFDMRILPWQFRCSWCEANWSLTDDRGFIGDACGHPQSDCGFHDWLAAQPAPPGRKEE